MYVSERDKVAVLPGFASVLGAAETIVYTPMVIISIVKTAFSYINALYQSRKQRLIQHFEAEVKLFTNSSELKDRVYCLVLAILTIVPFLGIIRCINRYRIEGNKKQIDDALDEALKELNQANIGPQDKKMTVKERTGKIEVAPETIAYKKCLEAAALGSSDAYYYLYEFRKGFIRNESVRKEKDKTQEEFGALAEKNLEKSVKLGNSMAQCEIGHHFRRGMGGKTKDDSIAAKWFRKSAIQGYKEGEYYLGLCYKDGKGVKKDPEFAHYLFEQAKDQNSVAGTLEYASNLLEGCGVAKNSDEGLKLLQEIVDSKHVMWSEPAKLRIEQFNESQPAK